jgi:hypothetical protein
MPAAPPAQKNGESLEIQHDTSVLWAGKGIWLKKCEAPSIEVLTTGRGRIYSESHQTITRTGH